MSVRNNIWFKAKKYKFYEGKFIIPEIDDLTKYDLENIDNEIFQSYYPMEIYQKNFETHNRREESPHLALFELGKILSGFSGKKEHAIFTIIAEMRDKLNELIATDKNFELASIPIVSEDNLKKIKNLEKKILEKDMQSESIKKELILNWCNKFGLLGSVFELVDKIVLEPQFLIYESASSLDVVNSQATLIRNKLNEEKKKEFDEKMFEYNKKKLKDFTRLNFRQPHLNKKDIESAERSAELSDARIFQHCIHLKELSFACFQPFLCYMEGSWKYSMGFIKFENNDLDTLENFFSINKKKAEDVMDFFYLINDAKKIEIQNLIKKNRSYQKPGFYQIDVHNNKFFKSDLEFCKESNLRGWFRNDQGFDKLIKESDDEFFYRAFYMESYELIEGYAVKIFDLISNYYNTYDYKFDPKKHVRENRFLKAANFNKNLSSIMGRCVPSINFDGRPNENANRQQFYKAKSLIGMIGMMIMNDFTNQNKVLKFCEYVKCKKPFYAYKKNIKYCCQAHSHPVRQQKYRDKIKNKSKKNKN